MLHTAPISLCACSQNNHNLNKLMTLWMTSEKVYKESYWSNAGHERIFPMTRPSVDLTGKYFNQQMFDKSILLHQSLLSLYTCYISSRDWKYSHIIRHLVCNECYQQNVINKYILCSGGGDINMSECFKRNISDKEENRLAHFLSFSTPSYFNHVADFGDR